MRARVIGLGQRAAGDDGVGLAVLDALRARGVPAGVEIMHAPEASELVPLLQTPATVVVVDAVLGAPPGVVLQLTPGELAASASSPVSTHGMGVAQAIALAGALSELISPTICVIAVTIARPDGYRNGLSPAVAAAVPAAVDRVLSVVRA
jgi:hydrogenase maturation protease